MVQTTRGAVTNGPRRFPDFIAPHPSIRKDAVDITDVVSDRQVYSPEYLKSVTPEHRTPTRWFEVAAWWWHVAARTLLSLLTLSWVSTAQLTPTAVAYRIGAFASVGLAGGVAGATHLHARSMILNASDNGWVHTLLGMAENSRMHGMIIGHMERPNVFARLVFLGFQAVAYFQMLVIGMLFPSVAQAYAGYRAEEQTFNYSQALRMVDMGRWPAKVAPEVARNYYGLRDGATMRDVFWRMRADDACNKHIAFVLASVPVGGRNPFVVDARKEE